MRLLAATVFLCSPLLLSGCILAAAGAGAGAGVALGESEHHDGHEAAPAAQDEDSAPAASSDTEAPPPAAAPATESVQSEALRPPQGGR